MLKRAGRTARPLRVWTDRLEPLSLPIGDGAWMVGVDVEPGRYEADGGAICCWQRLSGFSGTPEEVIAYGTPDDEPIMIVESTDRGISSWRCGTWMPAD